MARALRALTLMLAVAVVAGCSTKDTNVPSLSGPSELGLSLSVAVTPDILYQDGASQSQVVILARDGNGQPVRNVSMRIEIYAGESYVDFGTLSAHTISTGSDGRAVATYTAPPAPVVPVDNGTVVTLVVSPIDSNYQNTTPRTVEIRLVPTGTIIPDSDLVASFTAKPDTVKELETVVFDASASTGSIVSYNWNFGDGVTATGKTATHKFAGGTYSVTLTIKDAYDRAVSTTKDITVSPGTAPTASFVYSPSQITTGMAIYFNAAASTAKDNRVIVDYVWDFGDGQSGRGLTVSHSYPTAATYKVTLTVTDDAGRSGASTQSIAVNAKTTVNGQAGQSLVVR